MKLTLLNLFRMVMAIRHILPVVMLALVRISICVCKKTILRVKHFLFMFGIDINPLKSAFPLFRSVLVSMLLLFAFTTNSLAEGTKQLEPLAPSAANGSLGLVFYPGGWTANGQRIPFATVGCAAPYRLNVYISDPSTETIYFGFKQSGNNALFYQWRDPNGNVVPGYALTSQPTLGNPGYIPNWNQAVAGPKFGAMNPTGYTPLVLTPTIPGNYYLEFAGDAAGSTANMTNGTTIEFFDISVYQGNTIKNGRLWSEAWQFNDQIAGGGSPQTDFYIYSDDAIVTKLNINRWNGAHFMFYCNEWGVVNTGNWYTDRQSMVAPTQATWPGDLPKYKIFLNDPDNIVYPTGSFGTICDVQTNSKCDGSVEFLIKVNKPGKVELTIDIDPKGINNGEDIKLNADILGSPGCTTWDTVTWNGKNGFGQLLANGATISTNIDYLNGLTHLPIYDIETNARGIMVDLVRPVPSGSSKLNIFWDDTKVPNPSSNLTGCLYTSAASACHNWPINNQGNLVIYNSWWYYLADQTIVSPIIKRLPGNPTTSASGPTPLCAGSNGVYTIPAIQYAESYEWTLPNGSLVSTASNSISINFPTSASGGFLRVHGVNANCGAGNDSPPLLITVNQIPIVTATPGSLTICSEETTNIVLTSTAPNTTFSWTSSSPSSISGHSNSSGNVIADLLSNISNANHNVTYVITPVANGCTGSPITVVVTVKPFNEITALPKALTICTGNTFTINLSATLPGTSFSWTASGAGITGLSNGSGNVISQTLTNTTTSPAVATYMVTGLRDGCETTTAKYTVTVNPGPTLTNNPLSETRCSGAAFNLSLASNMAGATYSWTASGTSGLSGYSAGIGSSINQTVSNSTYGQGAVTYKITPAVLGCTGFPVDFTLTVQPSPDVNLSLNNQSICSGTSTTAVTLSSSVTGATYSWTAAPSGAGISGYSVSGSASIPSQTINSTLNVPGTVSYSVMPSYMGCNGTAKSHIVTINPLPQVTNASMAQTICSGTSSSTVNLTSNVAGTSYTWVAIPSSGAITGYQASGVNIIPAQTIFNSALTPGTITYQIIPSSNFGLSCAGTSANYTITVNPSPVIKSSLSEAVCSGDPFVYTITSDLAGTNFSWSRAVVTGISNSSAVGSSSFINETLINTTNSDIDVQYVLTPYLTAPSFCTGNSQTLTVKVRALPQVNAGPDVTIFYGMYTRLNGQAFGGTGSLNYSWKPNSKIASGINTLTPQTTKLISNQIYNLTVNDVAGCTAADKVTVNVIGTPIAAFPTPVSTTICAGEAAIINANASGGAEVYTYSWASVPPGFSSTASQITVFPQVNTQYIVTVDDGYNTASGSVIVTVNPLPAKFVLTGGGANCSDGIGVEVGLAGSESGVNYQLLNNGNPLGFPVSGTGSAISFGNQTLGGAYSVTATRVSTGCIQGMGNSVAVSILSSPVSFFSTSTQNCSNEPVYFTDLASTLYGYISEWTWDFGDGTSSDLIHFPDEPNISHRYQSPGTYTVTLKVTNSLGCSASTSIAVEVIEAPVANFQYNQDCSGLETIFRDASYANGPGNKVQYWWDFGDPSTGIDNFSNEKDATHIFSAPGTYLIKHIVRNFNNCTDTIIKPVVILTPVPIDFVYDYICVKGITQFRPDTSLMNIANVTSWQWNFGDGVTNYTQNTDHTYSEPGTYQVTLTINDISGCTATKIHTVVVNQAPVALFNIKQLPCANVPVHFDDASKTYVGFITKWNWDFGDGNKKQILYPANSDTEHIYSLPGTYTVKLTIVSSDSCTAESQQTIVINPAPVANFDYNNACQGTLTQFTDLTQPGAAGIINKWTWDFGDGASGINNTSALQNPVHTFTKTGAYQVSLTTLTANGCSSTMIKTVTITVAPFVDFIYDNHCADATIQFTPAAAVIIPDVATWEWSFGDGSTSTQPNPQYSYSTSGKYNVKLTITNATGCQSTISHILTILSSPVAKFSTNTPACSQNQVSFTNQSTATDGNIIRWEYNFGDGTSTIINFPENPNVSHTYSTFGNYNASLTVVSDNNCSATASRNIKILQRPLANFDFSGSCLGSAVQFNDLSQGNMVSWAWNFGDSGSGLNNTSNKQNPEHTYQQAGNFIVSLLVLNANGCSDTITRTVTISTRPAIDFSFNNGCASDTVKFISSSYINTSNTTSWYWQFGDNTTSADANPYHIYAAPGTYFVTLTITNKNGCTNVKTRTVQVTTAPIAMYTHTPLSCSGTAVLFTDLSSAPGGIIDSWNWNFDDGTIVKVNSPSDPNITHTFASGGFYNVTLTIHTSAGCYASTTTSIKINAAPVTGFTYKNNCGDLSTTFTDQSQGSGGSKIIAWSWDFGDPASGTRNISILQNPKHSFTGTGTFNVTLTTESNTGCKTTIVKQILAIASVPAVDFAVSSPCNNTPVLFSADPSVTNLNDVVSYLWDFGDGSATSASAQPSHLYSQPGNYNVTLTITNTGGCKNSVSKIVRIQSSPVAQFTSSGNCATNLVQFKDISFSPDGDQIVAWAWDFGLNNTSADVSSLQNPTFQYNVAGTYNVSLTITSASGCTAQKVMPVNVTAGPTALFSYVAESCHNGSVLFIDKSVSNLSMITSWKWEFAPGVYSTLQNPVHVFGDADSCFNVKLTVTTASGCSNTLIQRVCIPSGLKVDINYTQACFGETTWFTPTLVEPAGGIITSYKWNFGDPATGFYNESKLSNPQHTFSKPGTYVIALQVFDMNNCSTTRYMSITVDALPKSAFSYTGGTCDSLVRFTDETAGIKIARWIWKFGDGKNKIVDAPANPNVTHYYQYPGVYEATLITQSEAGCYDTVTNIVRRTPCITAAFAVKDQVVCQKRSMKFAETSTCQAPIASWQWFFGDGTSATFTSPQPIVEHTYATAGNYRVKMVVATQMVGGMATDTASSQVAVNPAAIAKYAWQDACVGTSTTFDNQSLNNNTTIKSYLWNFGNSGPASDTTAATNPVYNYKLSGQYDVKLVVTNTLGCTDTIVKKVNIFAAPAADFSWNTNCESKPVYFTDNSETASSAITNWNWKFSSEAQILDATTKRSCSVSFAHAGTYDATLKVTDLNGCSTSIAKQVTINTTPVVAFSIVDNYESKQGQILINNGTLNGTDYEWDFGNGKTSSAEAPIVTFDREGHYNIQLIAWNGTSCADTMIMEYDLMFKGLYVPNALNPGNMDPEVAVFRPKGVNLKSYYIEIYDRWGNLLWSSNKLNSKGSPAESWDGKLHGEVLQEGVYVWKISAQFNDGEVWDGTNSGNNDKMPQMKAGTVTLIR